MKKRRSNQVSGTDHDSPLLNQGTQENGRRKIPRLFPPSHRSLRANKSLGRIHIVGGEGFYEPQPSHSNPNLHPFWVWFTSC